MNVLMRVGAAETSRALAPAIEVLGSRLAGQLVLPGDEDYEIARALPHLNWDHKPIFIALVRDAADVADVVDFARRNGLEIAVRSGGHSVCGHSSADRGIVIDLRELKGLDIDTEARTVWAGSGLTAGEVSRALDEHQMVVGFGDTASVGIGGLTLGGGMGYMSRRLGLTIDALLAAEIVTASGDILFVDETHEPDLFWAIRGGGGNFGIVTRFMYRLHPLPDFVGGPLVLPATAEILAGFVNAAKAAPDELTAILMVMPAPPMPFLPEAIHGQTVLFAMMAYAGSPETAAHALAPFRSLAMPLADLVRPGPLFEHVYARTARHASRSFSALHLHGQHDARTGPRDPCSSGPLPRPNAHGSDPCARRRGVRPGQHRDRLCSSS
ncbi:FAD-binding oxidoreductase [Devosia crocina]|uniref:FAD-binding oxidoreductase n=1 Tax=Devosia crocina TaxID=429728 RepID=UPI000A7F2070|nr:FAD-binding oxidoreductase [Devosia crocina]